MKKVLVLLFFLSAFLKISFAQEAVITNTEPCKDGVRISYKIQYDVQYNERTGSIPIYYTNPTVKIKIMGVDGDYTEYDTPTNNDKQGTIRGSIKIPCSNSTANMCGINDVEITISRKGTWIADM